MVASFLALTLFRQASLAEDPLATAHPRKLSDSAKPLQLPNCLRSLVPVDRREYIEVGKGLHHYRRVFYFRSSSDPDALGSWISNQLPAWEYSLAGKSVTAAWGDLMTPQWSAPGKLTIAAKADNVPIPIHANWMSGDDPVRKRQIMILGSMGQAMPMAADGTITIVYIETYSPGFIPPIQSIDKAAG